MAVTKWKITGVGSTGGQLLINGNVHAVKHNNEATTNPVAEGVAQGYSNGSLWTNVSTGAVYICINASSGSWDKITTEDQRLKAVDGIQKDASFVPTVAVGQRYIIEDAGNLHANFGTITGLVDDDIVECDGTNFVVMKNASEGFIVYNTDDNNDYVFVDDGSPSWESREPSASSHWHSFIEGNSKVVAGTSEITFEVNGNNNIIKIVSSGLNLYKDNPSLTTGSNNHSNVIMHSVDTTSGNTIVEHLVIGNADIDIGTEDVLVNGTDEITVNNNEIVSFEGFLQASSGLDEIALWKFNGMFSSNGSGNHSLIGDVVVEEISNTNDFALSIEIETNQFKIKVTTTTDNTIATGKLTLKKTIN